MPPYLLKRFLMITSWCGWEATRASYLLTFGQSNDATTYMKAAHKPTIMHDKILAGHHMKIKSTMTSKPNQINSDRNRITQDNSYRKRREETHRCNRSWTLFWCAMWDVSTKQNCWSLWHKWYHHAMLWNLMNKSKSWDSNLKQSKITSKKREGDLELNLTCEFLQMPIGWDSNS